MNKTVLLTILYSSNCFFVVYTIENIRFLLGVDMTNPPKPFYKYLLWFNFSLLGFSAYTLVGLNKFVGRALKEF
jgi:hypothetical protein